jgi:hypothetical protein
LAEICIAAGVLGAVATWVASTGSRAAGREAQTPRLVGAGVNNGDQTRNGRELLRCRCKTCLADTQVCHYDIKPRGALCINKGTLCIHKGALCIIKGTHLLRLHLQGSIYIYSPLIYLVKKAGVR